MIMSATTKEKNKYEALDDAIILEALEENPDNKTEALRVASERLRTLRNKEATVNQLSSRYYSYILPHYIEGGEDIQDRLEQEGVSTKAYGTASAGSFPGVSSAHLGQEKGSTQLEIILALCGLLSVPQLKVLFVELFSKLNGN